MTFLENIQRVLPPLECFGVVTKKLLQVGVKSFFMLEKPLCNKGLD